MYYEGFEEKIKELKKLVKEAQKDYGDSPNLYLAEVVDRYQAELFLYQNPNY